MAHDIEVIRAARVAVDKEVLRRHGLDAHLAAHFAAQDAQIVELRQLLRHLRDLGWIDLLPLSLRGFDLLHDCVDLGLHRVDGVLIGANFLAQHLNTLIADQRLILRLI